MLLRIRNNSDLGSKAEVDWDPFLAIFEKRKCHKLGTHSLIDISGVEKQKNPKSMENHGKSWQIMAIIIMAFFGNFMVILGLNNIFKLLIRFSRSGLA